MRAAGVKALTLSFPATVRGNDYYKLRYPETLRSAEERVLFTRPQGQTLSIFEEEMRPYWGDPFRGTVERRVLGPGETALSLELDASKRALRAAGVTPSEIGLVICSSLMADQPGFGNAAYLARALGTTRPAWNLESTTSSALVALQTACACVSAGQYDKVLVVSSCTYSKSTDEPDPQTWFLGDGAVGFVVGPSDGDGFIAAETITTSDTCDAMCCKIVGGSEPRVIMTPLPQGGRILLEGAQPTLEACCLGALRRASLQLSDIDFFAFATPTAWFAKFACRVLDIAPEKTIDTYPKYGNVGPVLFAANLHAAVATNRIKRGDLVMMFSIGCASTASAAIFRWGDARI